MEPSSNIDQILEESTIGTVKVYLRLAPMEKAADCERCVSLISAESDIRTEDNLLPIAKKVRILNPLSTYEDAKEFSFEQVFADDISVENVYFPLKDDILSVLNGWNTSVIAYGPTNTGKTLTMCGSELSHGIISLALRDIFTESRKADSTPIQIKLSILELYNNRFRSLIDVSKPCTGLPFDTQAGEGTHPFVTPTRLLRSKSTPMPSRSLSTAENLSNTGTQPSFMRSLSATKSRSSSSNAKCKCIACDMYSANCNKVEIRTPEEGFDIVYSSFETRIKANGNGKRHLGSSRYDY